MESLQRVERHTQLSEDEVEFYVYNPQLHLFDLTIEKDAFEVKNIIKRIWSLKV